MRGTVRSTYKIGVLRPIASYIGACSKRIGSCPETRRDADMVRPGIQRCGVVLILTILCGCATSPRARRDKFLAEGQAMFEKKEYTRAILAFRNAIQAMP